VGVAADAAEGVIANNTVMATVLKRASTTRFLTVPPLWKPILGPAIAGRNRLLPRVFDPYKTSNIPSDQPVKSYKPPFAYDRFNPPLMRLIPWDTAHLESAFALGSAPMTVGTEWPISGSSTVGIFVLRSEGQPFGAGGVRTGDP
jgi:hypothetical protein